MLENQFASYLAETVKTTSWTFKLATKNTTDQKYQVSGYVDRPTLNMDRPHCENNTQAEIENQSVVCRKKIPNTTCPASSVFCPDTQYNNLRYHDVGESGISNGPK